jgi:hypothetical protein
MGPGRCRCPGPSLGLTLFDPSSSGSPAPHHCAIDGQQDDRPDGSHEDGPYKPPAAYAKDVLRYEPSHEGTGDTDESSCYGPTGVIAWHDQLAQSTGDRPDYDPKYDARYHLFSPFLFLLGGLVSLGYVPKLGG